MVPPSIQDGTVIKAAPDGEYNILEPIVTIELPDGTTKDLALAQKWPIRIPRPTQLRFPASVPLVTGQRILDTLFPIAKGGTAAVPGGFGTGKTMTQHQIAKWSDADIIIYIGCGERGNEMTQVLEDFSKLIDPKSGNLMMDRTTLIDVYKRQNFRSCEKSKISPYPNFYSPCHKTPPSPLDHPAFLIAYCLSLIHISFI